jgi:hypothetical protein
LWEGQNEKFGIDFYLTIMILIIIFMMVAYSIFSILTRHKSKNWNLEGTAKIDFIDTIKNNIKNNKLFFPMWFIFVFFVFNNDLVYFGAPFIVITIIFGIMYYIPPMRKKLYNPEIKLFDKGIFIEGYGHLKWNNFKGYYKKGGHIYLVLSYGFSKMVHSLKYNNKVENIIKSHLKEIK